MENDFKLNSADWYWNGDTNESAYYVFRFVNTKLQSNKRVVGPPNNVDKKHIARFKKKYKNAKVINGTYFAEIRRKYTDINKFLKVILRDKAIRKV